MYSHTGRLDSSLTDGVGRRAVLDHDPICRRLRGGTAGGDCCVRRLRRKVRAIAVRGDAQLKHGAALFTRRRLVGLGPGVAAQRGEDARLLPDARRSKRVIRAAQTEGQGRQRQTETMHAPMEVGGCWDRHRGLGFGSAVGDASS